MGKRVLVTGGAGFIGSHLVERLLQENMEVAVVDNFDPYYDPLIKAENIRKSLGHPNFILIEGDIRNYEKLKGIFNCFKPHMVVHLAAKAGVRPSVENPVEYFAVNVTGTVNVLEASIQSGIEKLIFASSSSVYGQNPKVPFSEADPLLNPASPYGASKISGEVICRSYSNCYRIPMVALRFFTVVGPRQRPDLAIHKFVKKIINNECLPIYGSGTTSRDYTYIGDIINGIMAALNYVSEGYEVFNLGNNRPIKLINMIQIIEEVLEKKALIEWLPMQTGDVPHTWADLTKSAKLGYMPQTGLKEGVEKFIRWFYDYAVGYTA